jgi:hypothetical protein
MTLLSRTLKKHFYISAEIKPSTMSSSDCNSDSIAPKSFSTRACVIFTWVRHLFINQNKFLSIGSSENVAVGLQDMAEAQKEKVTEEHNVIDEAIRDRGEGYTVFSIVSLCFLGPLSPFKPPVLRRESGYTVHPSRKLVNLDIRSHSG